jgi:hypothetical protein
MMDFGMILSEDWYPSRIKSGTGFFPIIPNANRVRA